MEHKEEASSILPTCGVERGLSKSITTHFLPSPTGKMSTPEQSNQLSSQALFCFCTLMALTQVTALTTSPTPVGYRGRRHSPVTESRLSTSVDFDFQLQVLEVLLPLGWRDKACKSLTLQTSVLVDTINNCCSQAPLENRFFQCSLNLTFSLYASHLRLH